MAADRHRFLLHNRHRVAPLLILLSGVYSAVAAGGLPGKFNEEAWLLIAPYYFLLLFYVPLGLLPARTKLAPLVDAMFATAIVVLGFTILAYTGFVFGGPRSSTDALVFLFAPMWLILGTPLVFLLFYAGFTLYARCRPKHPHDRCTRCGYSLYGLTLPRCPECGEPFALQRSREANMPE